ncbi:hypothetical protein GGI14_005762 [Coemansia sp. S680]|nr:hypothetical protein GGI14_005762 [Coemansia sp. S680]
MALFFADDIQLLPNSTEHLVEILKIFDTWCEESGMVVNISKCGALSSLFSPQSDFTIQGQQLPVVESYKYLGLPTTRMGKGILWHAWKAGSRVDISLHIPYHLDPGHLLVLWHLDKFSIGQMCKCKCNCVNTIFDQNHIASCFASEMSAVADKVTESKYAHLNCMDILISLDHATAIKSLKAIADILDSVEKATYQWE